MKIIAISDTHCQHDKIHDLIISTEADLIIHAGDGANSRNPYYNEGELRNVLEWMSSFTHILHKVYVPGNHDTSIERGLVKKEDFPLINILINEEVIIDSYKIYGSPITPSFGEGWSYNCKRHKIRKYWDMIPSDTDILVTHGPPKGVSDITKNYDNSLEMCGCKSLLNKVIEVEPKLHIFGHLHDEPGIYNHGVRTIGTECKTNFVNPSIVDISHKVTNTPIILHI